MALTQVVLKPNTFLTVDDVKDHLRIPQTNKDYDNRVARLINMVTELMEKYIDGPIRTREITEVRDGDASNTIVPDHWPVRGITEIRIDYNGDFSDPTTIITEGYFSIRGASDLAIGIKGTDICVRNDGNTSIIGRLFVGSVVSSIQLKYRAGLGDTPEELPQDVVYAALMAIEYFYLARENRELALSNKTNQGQSYTRSPGLPVEVKDILDQYRDTSLGRANRPQKNTFTT